MRYYIEDDSIWKFFFVDYVHVCKHRLHKFYHFLSIFSLGDVFVWFSVVWRFFFCIFDIQEWWKNSSKCHWTTWPPHKKSWRNFSEIKPPANLRYWNFDIFRILFSFPRIYFHRLKIQNLTCCLNIKHLEVNLPIQSPHEGAKKSADYSPKGNPFTCCEFPSQAEQRR